jgi:hypothetical protein
MFWFKRFKHNCPEEMKNSKFKAEPKIGNLNFKDIDYITEAITKALACRTNPLVKLLLYNVKNDEKFFKEFINFLERNQNKHDFLLSVVRTNLIESCRGIFSEKE